MAVFRFEHCVADVVLDGDTFWADIDLGVRCHTKQKIRVRNVHAVELKEPGGPEAQKILATLVPPGTSLEITSHRWSYDRIEGDVLVKPTELAPFDLAEILGAELSSKGLLGGR